MINMAVKIYTKEFAGQIPSIFKSKSAFLRSFGGNIQVIQGAEANDDFLNLKTSDTEVVIQNYNTDANVAFGSGTGSSNRFGPRHEVKSIDTQVSFDSPQSIHDGVDNYTVNDIPEQVVAERLAMHAAKWASAYDLKLGAEIAANASKIIEGKLTENGVNKAFSEARKEFVNNEVSDTVAWVAYVTADVMNLLVDSRLARWDKGSTVSMDNAEVYKYKGFILVEVADSKMTKDIYFVADGVGVAGVGIPMTRTIDSEEFAGVAIQSAGKLGKYIPEKNKNAIVVAELEEVEDDEGN